MKITYLLVNFLTVIVPFLFSFHPKLKFNRHFNAFFAANVIIALLFIIWDIFFTRLGVWGFNPRYLLGLQISNLPLEELLFFICIPFACVFTYHCLGKFFKLRWNPVLENAVIILLAAAVMTIGLLFYDRKYTAFTFISFSFSLLVCYFLLNKDAVIKLLSIYPVLLIPFFIVNGILTGTGLDEPVVWYNDSENLGIRLITIPVEDIFYGLELILLNVILYEWFKKKFSKPVVSSNIGQ